MELTEEQVTTAIQKVVAEKGDGFTYERRPGGSPLSVGCLYVWNNKPDCIVGCVLVDLGLSLNKMRPYEGHGVEAILVGEGVHMPRPVITALQRAQRMQDKGVPYGEVLVAYKDRLAHPYEAND